MAIKLPDPGNGIPEQKTGNDEWTNMKIVRDNFADQSNAASRLVGREAADIPLNTDAAFAVYSGIDHNISAGSISGDVNTRPLGERLYAYKTTPNSPDGLGTSYNYIRTIACHSRKMPMQIATPAFGGTGLATRNSMTSTGGNASPESWTPWVYYYHTGNTTKEEGSGYIVASSPVLKVQHDSFDKVHEAEQLDIEVKNIETGVYEITGTTGLREGDGWSLKPPKDVNGNVLCICEATEKNGVITLKTYKKKFDFETVSIVADYEQPTDIPEGATVMLRFNDLPQEQLDEPIE